MLKWFQIRPGVYLSNNYRYEISRSEGHWDLYTVAADGSRTLFVETYGTFREAKGAAKAMWADMTETVPYRAD